MNKEGYVLRRWRSDRRNWPSWLTVRARNTLDKCGFEHPGDILGYAPEDFYGVNNCGEATLAEFGRLYREQAAIITPLWAAQEGSGTDVD